MSCPVCGQTPPRGANFCFACGTSLARSCPRCQAGQSPDARFCPECGTRLPPGPGEAADLPVETAVAASRPRPDDEPEALDEAVSHTRGGGSGWRVAGLALAFLLVLIILAGAGVWLRAGQRPVSRVPASAARVVAPEPPVAPEPLVAPESLTTASAPSSPIGPGSEEPASERRSRQRSEAAGPALPERPADASARPVAPRAATPSLPPRPSSFAESPAASPRAARPGAEVSDVRIEIAAERRPGGVTDYSVRLRERDGTPVSGAAVSVRGQRPDGVLVEASLDPTAEPGVYQASLRVAEISGARLRVAREDRVEDMPLPR